MDIESQSGDAIATIESSPFNVHLDNFDGPFDLLLQLISRHKMDITEVSLSIVTDEFIAFIRALEASGEGWRLDQATEFLVIAATLLDLKAARLLPSGEIEDEEDLALLEARDILFARLLQYRAFKEIAATFAARIAGLADRAEPELRQHRAARRAGERQAARCRAPERLSLGGKADRQDRTLRQGHYQRRRLRRGAAGIRGGHKRSGRAA